MLFVTAANPYQQRLPRRRKGEEQFRIPTLTIAAGTILPGDKLPPREEAIGVIYRQVPALIAMPHPPSGQVPDRLPASVHRP